MPLHPYSSSCTRLKVSLPRTLCAQIILLSLQERKAAEKVKRDGMAHEMARYDKGSMFLNLITSKKSKTEPEPEPLGQPLQVHVTLCAARRHSCKAIYGSAKHLRPRTCGASSGLYLLSQHSGGVCDMYESALGAEMQPCMRLCIKKSRHFCTTTD